MPARSLAGIGRQGRVLLTALVHAGKCTRAARAERRAKCSSRTLSYRCRRQAVPESPVDSTRMSGEEAQRVTQES
jgi:hypothetical protein